jgi:sugar-specific transcriptional regulator TrmB
MDTKILSDIGLTQGEIKVYLSLLKTGSTSTGPLTDDSGVSRSKIYNVLERLMQKGLVSFILKNKIKYFQAAEPSKIKEYLEKKENEFKKNKEEVEKLMPQLELQQKMGKSVKEAQIYKGLKGIQTVHEHIYQRLKRGEEYFYYGIPAYQDESYHTYWHNAHLRRMKLGLKVKLLYNEGTDPSILKHRNSQKGCDARYMPIPISTPAWIAGYKDITAIGLPSDEGLVIEIQNQKVADSFKEYFEAFWKLSKKIK